MLTVERLQHVIAANPFSEAESDPKTLHCFFLSAAPDQPDMERLRLLKKDSERFELIDTVLYLHAPEGIGRSKLAAQVESAMGVPTTARNWRSVNKVRSLALDM